MTISIRNVDKELFEEIKRLAHRKNMNVGEAVNQALEGWKREHQQERISLLDINAWNWGEGTEHLSQEVDRTLYGKDTA